MKKMFIFATYEGYTEDERKQYKYIMYTADQYLRIIQHRFDKGKAKGMAEGKAEEKLTNARNFLAAGVPVETVASCTGLTEAEVKALQQN